MRRLAVAFVAVLLLATPVWAAPSLVRAYQMQSVGAFDDLEILGLNSSGGDLLVIITASRDAATPTCTWNSVSTGAADYASSDTRQHVFHVYAPTGTHDVVCSIGTNFGMIFVYLLTGANQTTFLGDIDSVSAADASTTHQLTTPALTTVSSSYNISAYYMVNGASDPPVVTNDGTLTTMTSGNNPATQLTRISGGTSTKTSATAPTFNWNWTGDGSPPNTTVGVVAFEVLTAGGGATAAPRMSLLGVGCDSP